MKAGGKDVKTTNQQNDVPPSYAPPSTPAPPHNHTNAVIEAAKVRARDEVRSTSSTSTREPHG